jgi:hypothetical protein
MGGNVVDTTQMGTRWIGTANERAEPFPAGISQILTVRGLSTGDPKRLALFTIGLIVAIEDIVFVY